MRNGLRSALLAAMVSTIHVAAATPEPPVPANASVSVGLFAAEPQIVTPIGATVDAKGRLIVVESNSHFRPKDYKGAATDRVQVFEDTTGTGHADKITTRYEGQNFIMNPAALADGSLILSSRNEIFKLDEAGKKTTLAHLETKADYPHNGLHGLTVDGKGTVYVGIGENFGGPWTLVGSDGKTVSDSTGAGAVFKMDEKGNGLTRLSHGFWNPFGLGVDPVGNVWAVDNDPDGRPPCRLVQIVPGADYGFEMRFGRTGLHPLQAWDGELPGTMPMVAGVGEAPSAVLWRRGYLLVSSWRDHVVQRITLEPRGASYSAKVETLLSGGPDFRPVGLALAPDGSVFVTDWASSSYAVHNKGRIWKLTFTAAAETPTPKPNDAWLRAAALRESTDATALVAAMDDADPFIAQAAQYGLSKLPEAAKVEWSTLTSPRQRIGYLRAMLDRGDDMRSLADRALADADDRVRQMAVRAITERDIKPLRATLDASMTAKALSPRLLQMTAAAIGLLDGDPTAKVDAKKINAVLIARLGDPKATDEAKAATLHMLLASHPKLDLPPLDAASPALQLEAVRYLNDDDAPSRFDRLAKLAETPTLDPRVRAEAIDGLSDDAANRADFLLKLTTDADPVLRAEALRSLRPVGLKLSAPQQAALAEVAKRSPADAALVDRVLNKRNTSRPPTEETAAWQTLLDKGTGDPDAGRRIFFHHTGGGCYHCHTVDGRGRAVGPDLSMIGHSQTRDHVLESILDPSKEIAPLFTLWTIKTKQGQTIDGMLLRRDGQSNEVYVDATAQEIHVKEPDVIDRKMRKESLMPAGLVDGMTDQEVRDLVAFLTQAR